jgi:hypothetical protein
MDKYDTLEYSRIKAITIYVRLQNFLCVLINTNTYVMILAYELAYSFDVMSLAYMSLCLIIHITYMIRIRAKLRWWFIVPSGLPMSYACQSIGSES